MRHGLIGVGLLLLAATAQAQTATPGQAFGFNYVIQDLATYSVTRFEMQVDGSAWASVQIPPVRNDGQTGAGNNTYVVPVPALTPGAHTVAFRACNTGGCGAASPVYNFTMVIVPPPTFGTRIVPVG